ncbi:AcrR family transcriptional regulator [Dietzia sp. 2505]|uniref:TetR/AcrR family transcriptional regulator n=1 Tax=Dietzia sp. 2505 TaxID=3156457 RepID=UPI00339959FC
MSRTHDAGSRSPGGRPRNPEIDRAVLDATLQILDERGYADLSIEEITRRAGTTRPALYRRWAGRPELVLAAIGSRLAVPPPPDTGCTLCDIGESFDVFLAAYRTLRPEVLSALYVDCLTDPSLRELYLDTIIEPARRSVGRTLARASERGDLRPDADLEQLLDLVGSFVHYRALFAREHLTDEEAWNAIELLMRGAAADYAELLAHSEALEAQHDDGHHVRLDQPR